MPCALLEPPGTTPTGAYAAVPGLAGRADGGIDVTDLQDVIGLLYRADWTRLSVSGDVRFESNRDLLTSRVRATRPPWFPEGPAWRFRKDPEDGLPPWEEAPGEEPRGYDSGRARMLIAPGGRYRLEYEDELSGQVIGSDGERGWTWHPQDLAPPPYSLLDLGD